MKKTTKKTISPVKKTTTTKKKTTATTSSSKLFGKETNILVLVESPNKTATIKKILQDGGYKNAKVVASVGHFVELKDGCGYKRTGVYPGDHFRMAFEVMPDKKDVFEKMKKAVEAADLVFICSDEDREGEAIGGHMKNFLKIPAKKCRRATFHEITPAAVLGALEAPRDLDEDLISAAHTRQALDKMVGYALSPVAKAEVNCKSVGRCQSAGLKLIVEREKEIETFKAEKYFDLFLHFWKKETEFKAKYVGTAIKEVKRLPDKAACDEVKKQCAE